MTDQVLPEHVVDLSDAVRMLHTLLEELVHEDAEPTSRIQHVDLTVANPGDACQQQQAHYDLAVQVDNPYAVTLELHASSDGGGNIIMYVPAHASRVLSAKVRQLSLKAIGNPAGAIPATVIRFDKPQPAGIYPYAP